VKMSKLLQTSSDQPTTAYIVDGMAMLQSLNENQFITYDDLAVVVQKRLVQTLRSTSLDVSSVTVVFDRYDIETSVKGSERQRRGATLTTATHQIKGGMQVPNYHQFLKGAGNKGSRACFVSEYTIQHTRKLLPHGKSIILAGGFSDGQVVTGLGNEGCFLSTHFDVHKRRLISGWYFMLQVSQMIIKGSSSSVRTLMSWCCWFITPAEEC